MTENSTGMSFAAVLKWILVIASIPSFIEAWQGVVGRQIAPSSSQLATGADAIHYGLWDLVYAFLFLAAAFAVWFFWQRSEE